MNERDREPSPQATEAAEAICAEAGGTHGPGAVRVVALALDRLVSANSGVVPNDPRDIRALKAALAGYIRQDYGQHAGVPNTSAYLRDVLTVLRDMPECAAVQDALNAGVAKLVGR